MNTMTPPVLAYAPETRTMSGQCGHVTLPPGPARLVECLLAAPGKTVPRSDLISALALPATVGDEDNAVLRAHLKVVRVLASTLSAGAWRLQMKGQDSVALVGPMTMKTSEHRPTSRIPHRRSEV